MTNRCLIEEARETQSKWFKRTVFKIHFWTVLLAHNHLSQDRSSSRPTKILTNRNSSSQLNQCSSKSCVVYPNPRLAFLKSRLRVLRARMEDRTSKSHSHQLRTGKDSHIRILWQSCSLLSQGLRLHLRGLECSHSFKEQETLSAWIFWTTALTKMLMSSIKLKIQTSWFLKLLKVSYSTMFTLLGRTVLPWGVTRQATTSWSLNLSWVVATARSNTSSKKKAKLRAATSTCETSAQPLELSSWWGKKSS